MFCVCVLLMIRTAAKAVQRESSWQRWRTRKTPSFFHHTTRKRHSTYLRDLSTTNVLILSDVLCAMGYTYRLVLPPVQQKRATGLNIVNTVLERIRYLDYRSSFTFQYKTEFIKVLTTFQDGSSKFSKLIYSSGFRFLIYFSWTLQLSSTHWRD